MINCHSVVKYACTSLAANQTVAKVIVTWIINYIKMYYEARWHAQLVHSRIFYIQFSLEGYLVARPFVLHWDGKHLQNLQTFLLPYMNPQHLLTYPINPPSHTTFSQGHTHICSQTTTACVFETVWYRVIDGRLFFLQVVCFKYVSNLEALSLKEAKVKILL